MNSSDLISALNAKTGFESVSTDDAGSRVRLLGRVDPRRMPELLSVVDALLAAASDKWVVDISKMYFRAPPSTGGPVTTVYAWRLIFETSEEVLPYEHIVRTIQTVRVNKPNDLMGNSSTKPPGRHRDINNPARSRGKGAAPMGQAIVGAAALGRYV